MADIIIKNGYIVDGTGSPWYRGDVSITQGRIDEVGQVHQTEGEIIDAAGFIVAPGFIDIHTHSDTTLPVNPYAESKIRQGVTTEVTGNCGNSSAPIKNEAVDEIRAKFENLGLQIPWRSMKEHLQFINDQGCSVNYAALIGHGTVRKSVVGYANREATPLEIQEMKNLIQEAMSEGAFGISTGLIYPPGCYTNTEELIELSKIAARMGGIYVSHIRDEGANVLEAGQEAVFIGQETSIPVHWSHVKAAGSKIWGTSSKILALMENSREHGIDISGDLYPYEATSTGLSMFLPKWAHDGGRNSLLERLKTPSIREQLKDEINQRRSTRGTWEHIVIASVLKERNKHYEGLDVASISAKLNMDPVEFVIDLLADENGEVGMISFAMCDDDIRTLLKHPLIMIGSDGNSLSPQGVLGNGRPHPRHYGTFPRVLGHYVRDEKVISLENAVKKMTSLPAWRLGIRDRGILLPGLAADITIFDPDKIADQATYLNPHQFPVGIHHVIVNGKVTIREGEHTGAKAGRTLKKNMLLA